MDHQVEELRDFGLERVLGHVRVSLTGFGRDMQRACRGRPVTACPVVRSSGRRRIDGASRIIVEMMSPLRHYDHA
jgi:hypothetical protein